MKRHTKYRRTRQPSPLLESLEPRQLLSASVANTFPTWTINGTPGNDVIAVAYNAATKLFDLTINGILVQ